MASAARKWLVGCGIGCGFMILAAGGVGTCGYLGVKKIKDRAERLDAGYEILDSTYGRPADYVPPADGTLAADRLEVFLAVRETLAPSRDELATVLTELDGGTKGAGGVLKKIGAGMSFVPRMFDFIDERNTALTDQGMGLGEYLYIYSVAYFAWLGMDPADGPGFTVSDHGDRERESGARVDWNVGSDDDDPVEVRRRRNRDIRRYLNRLQESMVRNQLEAAQAAALDPAWVARLQAEAEALGADGARLLWEEGLPEATAASLAPYRDAIAADYSAVVNALEVGLVEHD